MHDLNALPQLLNKWFYIITIHSLLYLEERCSLSRGSSKAELHFTKQVLQQENKLSWTQQNLLLYLSNIRWLIDCTVLYNPNESIHFPQVILWFQDDMVILLFITTWDFHSYLDVELRVQHRAWQQATLQNTQHLQVQLSKKLPVGHQADARPGFLLFLLFWLLLQYKRYQIFSSLTYAKKQNHVRFGYTCWVSSASVASSAWKLFSEEFFPAAFLFFPEPSKQQMWGRQEDIRFTMKLACICRWVHK